MISMANIIDTVNQIGSEVSDVLEKNKHLCIFKKYHCFVVLRKIY